MSQVDTFICGGCQHTFHDINLFIVHKNSQCGVVTEETSSTQGETQQQVYITTEDPQDQAQQEVVQADESGTITVIQQVQADGTVISEDQVTEAERQMCLIEVNDGESSNGITSEIHLVPLQRVLQGDNTQAQTATLITESGNVEVLLSSGANQDQTPKPPKKRPGRPRKSEQKPKPPVEKKEVARPAPEIGEDGKYRCPQCKKTFGRERHFVTHRCLATTDYVDSMMREVLSGDDSSEEDEEKNDKSDLYRVPGAPRRGRPHKKRIIASDDYVAPIAQQQQSEPTMSGELQADGTVAPIAGVDIGVNVQPTQSLADMPTEQTPMHKRGRPSRMAQETKKVDMKLPTSKDEIPNIPVFADENEKLAFEESLNVDLSEVDSMYKTHTIDQDVNEHAPPPVSRLSSELSVFSCNVCDKVFKTVSHMRLHCLTHTNLKPFRCARCSFASNSKGNLYTHMRTHTGQFYTCPACNFQSPNKTHLIEHIATHSKVQHKCGLCKKDYNTVKSLINHIRKYHTNKAGKEYLEKFQGKHAVGTAVLHQCHICLRKFKKKVDRDRHLFVHNIRGLPNVFDCELCDYTATQRTKLEAHFSRHRVVYVCAECGDKFPSSVRLNQHLVDVHGVSDTSENWMEIFQASIASSMYLPEPDGSTDTLFDPAPEFKQASGEELVPAGSEGAVAVASDKAVLTEAVMPAESTIPTICIRNGQPITIQPVTDDANRSLALMSQDQTGDVSTGDMGEVQATAEGVEQQEKQIGDEAGDDDINNTGIDELDLAEEYDIYKRLEYCQMSLDIFHKLRITFGTEECEFCGRLFFSKADFQTHYRSHTGERPFPCEQCPYRAATKDALKRHIEKDHDKVTYVCQECEFVASSRTQLWHHQQRHKEPSDIKCTECDVPLPSMKRLKAHLSVKHPNLDKVIVKKMLSTSQKTSGKLGRRSHKCPYCGKTFMRGSADLQKHIWIHQGIKPFKCSLCNHACRSKNNLMSHMMRHSNEKPFICSECGKAYKSRTALRWHVKTHKDGKIFRCVKCNYEAVQYSHLKRHMQTHDVVKRYVCGHCNYSANTLGYMKIHYTRNHKGEEYKENPATIPQMAPGTKVYRCLSCDYLFGNLSDIKRHLKVRHHVSVEDIHALDNIESEQPQTVELSEAGPVMVQDPATTEQAVAAQTVSLNMNTAHDSAVIEHHITPTEVQVVEPIDDNAQVATTEEQDASSALQSLQFSVPQSNMDPQTASAVSILQQIIGMQKQGAFPGQQQITVQSEDGRSYMAVNPDTIIVQDSGTEELVISGDGQEGEQQYVIQYVTAPPGEEGQVVSNTTGDVNSEVIPDAGAITDEQQLVNQQVVEMQTQEYVDTQHGQNIHVIMDGEQAVALDPSALHNHEDTGNMDMPIHHNMEVPVNQAGMEHIAIQETMEVPVNQAAMGEHVAMQQTMEVPIQHQTMEVPIDQTMEVAVSPAMEEVAMPQTLEEVQMVYTDMDQETTVEEHTTIEIVPES